MVQWLIYKHTSLKSGKSYIGQTKFTMEKRWKQHILDSRRDSYNSHFHRAIRLYGEDNWESSILADGIDTSDEANSLENFFIKKYDTFENGYNLTNGGSFYTSSSMDNEYGTITLVHEYHDTAIGTISELVGITGATSGNIKKVLTVERFHTKGYVLAGNDPKGLIPSREIPFIFKTKHGEVFRGTANDLKNEYALPSVGNIDKVLSGERRSLYGWHIVNNSLDEVVSNKSAGRPVFKYSIEGKMICSYSSSMEAAKSIGLTKSNTIYDRCCNSVLSSTYYGFKWSFQDLTLQNMIKDS